MKREATAGRQSGAQIHSQHTVQLLVPLQVLRMEILYSCERETRKKRAITVFCYPVAVTGPSSRSLPLLLYVV